MLTSAQFFSAFDRAGFLVNATWTNRKTGEPSETARVDFRSIDEINLNGDVVVTNWSMTYPENVFIGLDHGDEIIVAEKFYIVRVEPRKIQDGSVMRTVLGEQINNNR